MDANTSSCVWTSSRRLGEDLQHFMQVIRRQILQLENSTQFGCWTYPVWWFTKNVLSHTPWLDSQECVVTPSSAPTHKPCISLNAFVLDETSLIFQNHHPCEGLFWEENLPAVQTKWQTALAMLTPWNLYLSTWSWLQETFSLISSWSEWNWSSLQVFCSFLRHNCISLSWASWDARKSHFV